MNRKSIACGIILNMLETAGYYIILYGYIFCQVKWEKKYALKEFESMSFI